VKRWHISAVAGVVVVATVLLMVFLVAAPGVGDYVALAGLIVAELYLARIVLFAADLEEGDSNNYLPATAAALLPVVVGILVLVLRMSSVLIAVMEVIAWALALIFLFLSVAHNREEADHQIGGLGSFDLTPGSR
jgi:hypothetical protein